MSNALRFDISMLVVCSLILGLALGWLGGMATMWFWRQPGKDG